LPRPIEEILALRAQGQDQDSPGLLNVCDPLEGAGLFAALKRPHQHLPLDVRQLDRGFLLDGASAMSSLTKLATLCLESQGDVLM
jgi:hypothetical protein